MTLSSAPVHFGHRIILLKPLTANPLLPRTPPPVKRERPVNSFSENFNTLPTRFVATVFSCGLEFWVFEQLIEQDDEFAHHGDQGDFGSFAGHDQALVEHDEPRV